MEPARLSITHTADSSMKNVICDGDGEREREDNIMTLCLKVAVAPVAQCTLLMNNHSK